MKVLGIVPARAGSKRVPGKNMRLLGGKPLVRWAIEAGLKARGLDTLVVSSDDPDVLAVARELGDSLALPRPAELATDTSLSIDYVRHALAELESRGQGPFAAVAILQPTSPFTLPADVDATIELLASSQADSAVSVVRLEHDVHPAKLKRLEGASLLPYLEEERGRMASHELSDVYVRNGSVYVTRRHVLDAGQILGADCRGFVMPRERSVDINDSVDLEFAEFLLARRTPGESTPQ